jgi:hypothetical protein
MAHILLYSLQVPTATLRQAITGETYNTLIILNKETKNIQKEGKNTYKRKRIELK